MSRVEYKSDIANFGNYGIDVQQHIYIVPNVEIHCYADKERPSSDGVADVKKSREIAYRRRGCNHLLGQM